MTAIMTDMIFFIASLYISYIALKRYLNEPTNYEHTLYWGIAFMFNSVHFIIRSVYTIVSSDSFIFLSNMSQLVNIIAWWLQLFAVMFVVFDYHSALIRKKVRVFMYFVVIYLIIFASLISIFSPGMLNGTNIAVDIFLDSNILFISIAISIMLFRISKYGYYLYIPYLLFSTSNIVHIINDIFYNEQCVLVQNSHEALAVGAILTLLFEVRKLIKGKKKRK